jgi:hypothetical protein
VERSDAVTVGHEGIEEVGQVHGQLAVLEPHDCGLGRAHEAAGLEGGGHRGRGGVDAERIPADVEDGVVRRAVGIDHAGFHERGRQHDADAIHGGEVA